MNCFVREKFWIEIEEQLLCFYRIDDKIYFARYKEYSKVKEELIINGCTEVINVILSSDKSISIIYTDLKGQLKLSTFLEYKVVNTITLVKWYLDYKNMEITSVNNSLNIFYINEVNKINTLCYRVLSNKLTLTPPVIIDGIDVNCKTPYITSANNGELSVCYVKLGSPRTVGYRTFDFLRNSWSNFNKINNISYEIEDMNFLMKNNTLAYSYSFIKHKRGTIICGIGNKENVNRSIIEEAYPNISASQINITKDNKLNLIYLVDNILKIKEESIENNMRSLDEIILDGDIEVKKYQFASENECNNNMLIINSEDKELFIDSSFIQRISTERYNAVLSLKNSIEEDRMITDDEFNTTIENLDLEEDLDNNQIMKKLISKIKVYEEAINKITENLMQGDEEKKKLLENIDYLNDQINKRNHRINSFEQALAERQNIVLNYEKKVQELTNNAKIKEITSNNAEVAKLREAIKINDSEKESYLNELLKYKNQVENLNKCIKNKEDEINILIMKKENEICTVKNENTNYSNEIETLRNKINELKTMLTKSNEEATNLKNKLVNLQEKTNESFIKKLFKNGE